MAATPGMPTCSARLSTVWSVRTLRLDGIRGPTVPERLTGLQANDAHNLDERDWRQGVTASTAVHVAPESVFRTAKSRAGRRGTTTRCDGHHALAGRGRARNRVPELCWSSNADSATRMLGPMVVAVASDPRCYPTSGNLIGRPATVQDDDVVNETHVRTMSDGRRRFVSDYGSEGWGFESLRARKISPGRAGPEGPAFSSTTGDVTQLDA
jgi:hypothetical protein